ncbi:MAG: hypothetical protein QFF03_19635 [Pseudomonadota bacterium]|nr:hypothetical protein [Pseudomonadota bacterium]
MAHTLLAMAVHAARTAAPGTLATRIIMAFRQRRVAATATSSYRPLTRFRLPHGKLST